MDNKYELIEPEIKAFKAITRGSERVLKKAGVDERMLVALSSDRAPATLVGISEKLNRKQFIKAIRDLVLLYGKDRDDYIDLLGDIVDEFDNPSMMLKIK